MPYVFAIDAAARLVRVQALGPSDAAETLEAISNLARMPGYEPDFGILVDARAHQYVASFADLIRLRDGLEHLRERFRGPIAVVLGDPLRYGATRGLGAMTDLFGIRLRAFREMDAASAWLADPR
jgi:hypothetical protein